MKSQNRKFLFLNVGHFLDHYCMLIFATAAALRLNAEWGLSYSELIPYATPGFIAFGVCALPAGWIADKWSRDGMLAIFFLGIGLSTLLTGFANSPLQIAIGLAFVGVFAAIYHPVGLAMVVQGRVKTGVPLAVNGVFGNMGVACAALLSGFLIDTSGWRSAFFISGSVAIIFGIFFIRFIRSENKHTARQSAQLQTQENSSTQLAAKHRVAEGQSRTDNHSPTPSNNSDAPDNSGINLIKVFGIIFFTTALGSLVFQSTTFALPKVFEERLTGFADTATLVGWYAFLAFSLASFAQLIVGYLVDTQPIRTVFASVAFLQAVFFAVMIQLNGIAALVVAFAFMLVVFGQIPINDVLVGRLVKSEWRSRAYGLRYIIGFTVMASAIPIISWIHGEWGFDRLFAVLSVLASLIFIAVLFLPKFDNAKPLINANAS